MNNQSDELSILQSLEIRDDISDALTLAVIPAAIPDIDELNAQIKGEPTNVEGAILDLSDASGNRLFQALRFTCVTDNPRGNRLFVGGQPLVARQLSWRYERITWQPGVGHPVYNSHCPTNQFDIKMPYRHAFRHQIVPIFGGRYWIGCNNPATARGERATEVFFNVNDEKYDDNRGTFNVIVTSWSS